MVRTNGQENKWCVSGVAALDVRQHAIHARVVSVHGRHHLCSSSDDSWMRVRAYTLACVRARARARARTSPPPHIDSAKPSEARHRKTWPAHVPTSREPPTT
eukprot:6204016-Pleurochrysis_carterae.AAC.1